MPGLESPGELTPDRFFYKGEIMDYYETKQVRSLGLVELWIWLTGKVVKYGVLLVICHLILKVIK